MVNESIQSEDAAGYPSPTWFLAGQFGGRGEMSYVPISRSPFNIGRLSGLSLCLPFRTISGVHAELRLDAGRLILRDLASTNGTFVNGARVDDELELHCGDLIQFADIPIRVHREARESGTAMIFENLQESAFALVQLERLLSGDHIQCHYQPIVDLDTGATVAYEALGRSNLLGVDTASAMFHAAERLNLQVQLSQRLRWEGIRQSRGLPPPLHVFVNTHPTELALPGLAENLRAIRKAWPARRLTLEIHEAAITDEGYMSDLRQTLDDLQISLAYDDFGAGQTRLAELVNVRPEYLKFDISLIRGVDIGGSLHNRMVASLVTIVRDLGIVPLAEGVETLEQSQACRDLGFQLVQGFWYGKPAPCPLAAACAGG